MSTRRTVQAGVLALFPGPEEASVDLLLAWGPLQASVEVHKPGAVWSAPEASGPFAAALQDLS